jgi:putative membrane protein
MTKDVMKTQIDKTVDRYSLLFTLPSSTNKVLLLHLLVNGIGGITTFLLLNRIPASYFTGLFFGMVFLFITLITDLVVQKSLLKNDPIFNLRRNLSLSLFSSTLWFIIIILGTIMSVFTGSTNLWLKFYLLGFSFVVILRLITFSAISSTNRRGQILSALVQPIMCCLPLLFMNRIIGYQLDLSIVLFIPFTISFSIILTSIFIASMNRIGKKKLGIETLTLLRAFVFNWAEDLYHPLEQFLERLGHEQDVKTSILAFSGKKGFKGIMVVPSIHPGPFKNVGSSVLPHKIQMRLEDQFHCITAVPHGLCGHDLDLTSQLQNKKVVDEILNAMEFSTFSSEATPFERAEKNGAKASCQIFGKCALITLTMAPQTMEDLPQELSTTILLEAKKRGLSSAIIIDAHNSIKRASKVDTCVDAIKAAAITAIDKALRHHGTPFEVGTAKIIPENFSVKEGLGPGGISALVGKVGDQKSVYITIDGNNMVSGLRERVLLNLKSIDIEDGEILTTDTHMVTSLVLTKRGYHPVGEAIDQERLIEDIKEVTLMALRNLEPVKTSWKSVNIKKIKIIGEKQLKDLFIVIDEAIKRTKRLGSFLLSVAGIILIFLLFFV